MLYISTQDPRGANVTVEIPRAPALFTPAGFPMTFRIDPFEAKQVAFPTENGLDISVRTEHDHDRGIHVISTNGAKLDIVGVSGVVWLADSFLALPCKLENGNQGNFFTSEYKYFIFSADGHGTLRSIFLIIPCTPGGVNGNGGIEYTIPGQPTVGMPSLAQYETALVESINDLTGTVITSPWPLAVFAAHGCGLNSALSLDGCNYIVEQIPPDITYGTRFFILPFTVRQSGDIIRVGSTLDNNKVFITCTRGQVYGDTEHINLTQTINSGGFVEHRTREITNPLSTLHDNCYIETSKPAIVMQYILGLNVGVIFRTAMSLVPPIEQYSNNYAIVTAGDVHFSTRAEHFISWVMPSQFFNPATNDGDNFLVNSSSFTPTMLTDRGSGGYIPIYCSDGEICGYGGAGRIQSGYLQVSYQSSAYPDAAMYVSVYSVVYVRLFAELVSSQAYAAGMKCDPIGRKFGVLFCRNKHSLLLFLQFLTSLHMMCL